jgi:hypothetical protein
MCSAKGHVRFSPESDAECVHSNFRYGPMRCINYRSVVGAFEHRETNVEQLTRELAEAREREAATAEECGHMQCKKACPLYPQ